MKTFSSSALKQLFLLAGLVLISLSPVQSQHIDYANDSGWKFGFNFGGTWQQSDMVSKAGIGFGATLGKAIYQKPGRFFAFDIRFRYLHGFNYGYTDSVITTFRDNSIFNGNNTESPELNDYRNNQGRMFYNYRMSLNEYALEGVLTFNRLREKTGIVLYGWGGIGLTTYRVKTNQLDLFDRAYNYAGMDSVATWSDLNMLYDNSYETDADGNKGLKVGIMPSAGIGFGYQFSPYFAMVLEHKVTFSLIDNIDAYAYENTSGPVNDRYHYTGLKFVFRLGKGNGGGHTNYNNNNNINNYTTTTTNTNTATTTTTTIAPTRQRPIVNITQPSVSPATVNNQYYNVLANIYNIDSFTDILFKVNGVQNTNFTYNTSSKQFSSNILLNPGSNLIEIRATNEVGSDYQSVMINFEMPVIVASPPPIVTFTNPPFTPFNTNNATFNVTATILNIQSSANVSYRVNGQLNNSFTYNPNTKAFSSVVNLHAGPNTIEIKAANNTGTDTKQVVINYQPIAVQVPPVVTITNPTLNPYTVNVNSVSVDATVLNVNSANDITLKINGQISSNFTYNTGTKAMNIVASLINGANTFEIKATNSAGSDTKTTTIVYVKPSALPPVVNFTDPAVNPYTITSNTKLIKASVLHVAGQSNIQVKLNGTSVSNFSYNINTKVLQYNATLVPGANVLQITATNSVGSDVEATTIIYQKQTSGQPPVVTISSPSQDPYNTTMPNASIIGSVQNVGSASQISFKVNGVPNSNFTFDPSTKVFISNVTLNPGANVYEITGTNNFGTDAESQTINYTIPCNSPQITLVQPASINFQTSLSSLPFSAIVQNISNSASISFKLNGNNYPFTFDPNSGTVNATLALTGTSNTVELKAVNNCGQATQNILIYYQAPLVPPVVNISTPATNPFTSVSSSTTVNASILHVNSASNVLFKVNGTPTTAFTFNPQSTLFSANINLIAGANTIEITGTNSDGIDSKSTVILYQPVAPPCQQPVIVMNNPSGTSLTTAVSSMAVSANLLNVTNSNNITFKLNGANAPFTFNAANGSFSANVTFSNPNNTLEIVAVNSCGSSSTSINVTYNRPLVPPVVTILNPGQNPFTSNVPNYTITAKILNINGASDVTYTVNGNNTTNFTYDANTDIFSSNVTLNQGNNVFTIKGTNNDGSDMQSTTIIYVPVVVPCSSPVITMVAPATTSETVVAASYTVSANILNATQNQISFKHNGANKAFNYNATTHQLTATITLTDGSNSFEISAGNNCGTENANFTVTYNRPLQPPVVTITAPASNPYTSATATCAIAATVQHVGGASDITFKLNGVPSTAFAYNATTDVLTANVNLVSGTNTVEITGTNADGSDTKNTSIIYQYVAPCNPPTVNITSPLTNASVSSPTATFAATVTNVSNQSAITLKLNGASIPFTFSNGQVNASLTLAEGSNFIEITAGSNCGNASDNVSISYTRPLVPPTVSISAPQNGSSTQNASSNVTATVTNVNGSGDITFLVNGNASTGFTYNPATDAFSASINLNSGLNTIVIQASNSDGQASDQTSITYQPCLAPAILLSQPAVTGTTVSTASFNMNAMVQNGNNTTAVVTLNGNAVNSSFDGNTVSATLNLNAGSNTIQINVTGTCGTDTENFTLQYQPCLAPEITLGSGISNGTTVVSATYPFNATIANGNNTTATVTLNGNPLNATYNGSSLSGNATLIQGSNTIEIVVNGPCGSDTKQINVTYAPCAAPVIIPTNPNSPNSVVTDPNFNVLATIQGGSNNVVTVNLNGVQQNSNYNGSTVSAGIVLPLGTSTVQITVRGDCGDAVKSFNITYNQPCATPAISLVSATAANQAAYNLQAFVSNATQSGISLKLNGTSKAFNYDANSGALTAQLTLADGNNDIKIVASECDTVTANFNVVYTYSAPCNPVSYTRVNPSQQNETANSASYSINLDVQHVQSSGISATLNGNPLAFVLNGTTLSINPIALVQGTNAIVVTLSNACSNEVVNYSIAYNPAPSPCGPRFNPGNSAWEFCLITPSGTYTRDDLASNPNFSYSGAASSVYFKPIAGGGDAMVNGAPMALQNGSYYLFSGNLTVNVSSNHPGSMGHWTICLESNAAPTFGNGNNRPASPCESSNGNKNNNGGNGGNNGNGGNGDRQQEGGNNNPQNNGNPNTNTSGDKTGNPQNNAQETENQYKQHLANGDAAFAEGKFAVAKKHYQSALSLKPNEEYPKNQIARCEQALKDRMEAKKKEQEAAKQKAAEQEAQRKAKEEAQRKAQENAQKNAQQEEAKKKAAEEAKKKAAEEAAKKKAAEEAAKKKANTGVVRPGGKVGVTVNEEGVK